VPVPVNNLLLLDSSAYLPCLNVFLTYILARPLDVLASYLELVTFSL